MAELSPNPVHIQLNYALDKIKEAQKAGNPEIKINLPIDNDLIRQFIELLKSEGYISTSIYLKEVTISTLKI